MSYIIFKYKNKEYEVILKEDTIFMLDGLKYEFSKLPTKSEPMPSKLKFQELIIWNYPRDKKIQDFIIKELIETNIHKENQKATKRLNFKIPTVIQRN